MTQLLAKLLIAAAASQWLYAELILYHPEVDDWSKRAMKVLSISTNDRSSGHTIDQMRETMRSWLGRPVPVAPPSQVAAASLYKRSSPLDEVEKLLARPIAIPGRSLAEPEIEFVNLFEDTGDEPRQYLWGSEIFDSEGYKREYFRDRI